MKPYYADDFVTLYHGDGKACFVELLGPECAIVTDPPYGTGWVRGGGAVGEFTAKHEKPEWDVWSTDWLAKWACFTRAGAVFSPLGKAAEIRRIVKNGATAYWRKTNPRPNGPDRDAITIWPTFLPDATEFKAYNGDTPFHPCQKPLDLMQWVLGFIDPKLTILDPFAGSGTTLVAAKMLGRNAIGVEQDEAYCGTIVTRLSQEALNFGDVA